jgi:hypothetical protein
MSLEGGSGETCSQRFPPKPNPSCKTENRGWKGDFESTIFIPLTVGVRTMIIVMMGTTHPHLQASEASAPGGGNQRFPRNEGGRGERSEPTLPRVQEEDPRLICPEVATVFLPFTERKM